MTRPLCKGAGILTPAKKEHLSRWGALRSEGVSANYRIHC